ncbi:MAG TPA: hypothetical protein P5137_05990 [Candidatus Brocadiia bacterium]|nr:hypothetical protein [Candidatus Brocadiia bacterium]
MRSRRGGDSAPLSLFSFQDIITTVSGIMLLVMLMLALEVVARPAGKPAPAALPKAATSAEEVERLRQEIAQARREVEQAAKLNLDDAPAKVARLEQEMAKTRERTAQLNAAAEASRQRAEAAARAAAQARQEEERLKAELEGLRKRLDEQEAQNRVHYTFARETNKTPVLVECSASGIAVRVAGKTPQVVSFVDASSPHYQSSLRRFQAWARGRSPAREAFIVLVKPSAAGYAQEVIDALKQSGFDVGHEPLEEDRTAIGAEGARP